MICTLIYSDIPAAKAVKLLKLINVHVTDASGSLDTGFQAKSIVMDSEFQKFRINGLTFKFNGVPSITVSQKIHISQFTIDEIEWEQLKVKPEKDNNHKNKNKSNAEVVSDYKKQSEAWLKSFHLDHFEISKMSIKRLGSEPFLVENFTVKGISSESKELLGSFNFQSNYGTISIKPYDQTKGWAIAGVAKPILFKALNQDIDFDGNLLIGEGKIKSFSLNAFSKLLNAKMDNDDLKITADQLELATFFKKDFPLSGFSGGLLWKDFQKPDFSKLEGQNFSIKVGQTSFAIPNGQFIKVLKEGENEFIIIEGTANAAIATPITLSVRIKPQVNSKTVEPYKIKLTSTASLTPDELLGLVYFGKIKSELTPEEAAILAENKIFFIF